MRGAECSCFGRPIKIGGVGLLTLFLFGTDGYGLQEPRVQLVRGYGFYIIAVENGRFRRNSVCCGTVYGS